ncbi:MAG: hypothetical protein FWG34_09550 [Oscillospiraceae bacterium]|nr:hypothetical protein [Oscillospiraceae bacterium]
MTNKERWESILKNKTIPDDRLPVMEWSVWWTETVKRWESEGMPKNLGNQNIHKYFGLDEHCQFMVSALGASCPHPASHFGPRINSKKDYGEIKKHLFKPENIGQFIGTAKKIASRKSGEKCPVSLLVHGFFWFPRELFGVENHFYAFYDCPGLMHMMNEDLLEYNKNAIDEICDVLIPDILCLYEDMSYNHGAMLSKKMFDEFVAPYYRKLIAYARKKGMVVFVDTDGNLESLIPWYIENGVQGVTPLERQAGVDVERILCKYPDFLAMGGFDKMAMPKGETAMRSEFERIFPAMKTGRYIVSVDHQTPPGVSIENYKIYLRLLREYCAKAAAKNQKI